MLLMVSLHRRAAYYSLRQIDTQHWTQLSCDRGRLDVHVRFENAGRAQIEELFRCFFLPSISSQPSGKLIDGEENERFSDSDEGYGTLSDNSHDELDEDISPGNASVLL